MSKPATVRRDISDDELRALNAAGARGVRFNFVKRLVDFTPKDELNEIAVRIAPLGGHVVIYFEAQDLPELWDFFTALPTTVVVTTFVATCQQDGMPLRILIQPLELDVELFVEEDGPSHGALWLSIHMVSSP